MQANVPEAGWKVKPFLTESGAIEKVGAAITQFMNRSNDAAG
jgi:hypothetical protein